MARRGSAASFSRHELRWYWYSNALPWRADFTSYRSRSSPPCEGTPRSRTRIEANSSQSSDMATRGETPRASNRRVFPRSGPYM